MRVVVGDAVDQLAAREQAIPHFLHAGNAAAAEVVDLMVAVDRSRTAGVFERCSSSAGMAHSKLGWLMCGMPPALRIASTLRWTTSTTDAAALRVDRARRRRGR